VPSVDILSSQAAANLVAKPDNPKLVAVRQDFAGPFSGRALLIFPETNSLELMRARRHVDNWRRKTSWKTKRISRQHEPIANVRFAPEPDLLQMFALTPTGHVICGCLRCPHI
jgi:hypothetical protein